MIAIALKSGAQVRVWPRPGLRVPFHPDVANRWLPTGGAVVEWSAWWARRVADGTVVLTDPSRETTPLSHAAPAEGGER